MMKCTAILALAGSAAAFAPTQPAARMSTAMDATAAQKDFFGLKENVDFSKELGVQAPVSERNDCRLLLSSFFVGS
jgi:hypothetical protein